MNPLVLALLSGCADIVVTSAAELSSQGVVLVRGRVQRGDLLFQGIDGSKYSLVVDSLGSGTALRARQREAANSWGALNYGGVLDIWATLPAPHTRVDVALAGPGQAAVDAVLGDGQATLLDVHGGATITASAIFGRGLEGDLDLYADGGVDVQAAPIPGDTVTISSARGDVLLGLPEGGEYDIEVFAAPRQALDVVNLGFSSYGGEAGYFRSVTGAGTIRVRVYVDRGSFHLVDFRDLY